MPLEQLLAGLERDARAQADAELAEARATATGIARDADERLARRRGEALGVREAELRGAAEVALARTRREARRRVLEAREALLERVLAAARSLLPGAVTAEAYRTALPAQLAEALRAVGDGAAVIRCLPALVPAVEATLARHPQLAVQGDPAAPPGLTVVTADGAMEVDDTLDGRLDRMRVRLALDLIARLEASR